MTHLAPNTTPTEPDVESDAELSALQLWMSHLLRHGSDLGKDPEVRLEAQVRIGENPRLLPVEQLEIYREQFWLRHTGSLLEDFPGLSGILGQEDWERLAQGYLRAHVSASYTLRNLGCELPAFIKTCDWLPHQSLCYEMARLEWAYTELFDAPDALPLDPEKLALVPAEAWDRASLKMNPALQLLAVDYPVATLRRKLRDAAHDESVPIPEPQPERLVLYRGPDRGLYFRAVSPGAFALLSGVQAGLGVVAAAERSIQEIPNEPIFEALGGWFREWGKLNWIVDVVY